MAVFDFILAGYQLMPRGAISMLTIAHYSDKIKLCFPFIIPGHMVALAGFAIQISDVKGGVKYFGLYLCVIGMSSSLPCIVGW